MTKHQKLTLILILTLSLVFVVFTPRAFSADFWGTLTTVGLTATVGWIFELIMQFLGIGIWIGGAVFDMFLSWGNFLAEPSEGGIPIIVEAWKIIRDFVNVSFIFVLLTIAISTILGIEKYGIKTLFAQLVIMALLVNFSLVLVRVVLDTSNLVTNFFIKGSGVGGLEMSQKLVGSLGIQKVWNAAINYDVGAGGVASTFLISMIMGIVVLLATLIVIWLAAGLLVVRIIILAFVAIFAPAAFLARIIPGGQSLWAKWWKTLINWALFTPAFAFFLYLAMRTADTFSQIQSLNTANLNYQAAVSSFFSLGNNLIQYILVLGFTLGGLLMAKQFGVYGGAKAFAMGSKALKAASGYSWAGKKGKEAWKNYKQQAKTTASRFGRGLAGRFENVPVIGRFAQRAQIEAAAVERAGNKAIISKYDKYTEEELGKIWGQLSQRERAVLTENMAKKDKLHKAKLTPDQIKATAQNMHKYQTDVEEVFNYMPSLAPEISVFRQKLEDKEGRPLPLSDDEVVYRVIDKIKPQDFDKMLGSELQKAIVQNSLTLLLGDDKRATDQRHLASALGSNNVELIQELIPYLDKLQRQGLLKGRVQNWYSNTTAQALIGMMSGGGQQPVTPTPPPVTP